MSVSQQDRLLLAVDLGGTKVASALITSSGSILARLEEPTCQLGPQLGIEQIVRMLHTLQEQGRVSINQVLGVGVGIPAVLAPETDFVIWAPNLNGWREVDLRQALEEALHLPAYIEYDGHTAILGEWWLGAGQGYRSIAMVIVGTGIGGGLILDGRLVRGRDRLAGAAGWFALTADAQLEDARSYSMGHWESLAAGPGITLRAKKLLPDDPTSRLNQLADAGQLGARQIFDAARLGDPLAERIVAETAGLLGLGVANIVSLVNPEIVILGGSIGRQGDLLLEGIRRVILRWAQPASARSVAITTSKLGSDAGLYGAAYAVFERTGSVPPSI